MVSWEHYTHIVLVSFLKSFHETYSIGNKVTHSGFLEERLGLREFVKPGLVMASLKVAWIEETAETIFYSFNTFSLFSFHKEAMFHKFSSFAIYSGFYQSHVFPFVLEMILKIKMKNSLIILREVVDFEP